MMLAYFEVLIFIYSLFKFRTEWRKTYAKVTALHNHSYLSITECTLHRKVFHVRPLDINELVRGQF